MGMIDAGWIELVGWTVAIGFVDETSGCDATEPVVLVVGAETVSARHPAT